MRCIGWGEFESKCNNQAGHHDEPGLPCNPIWCKRCDILRTVYIEEQLTKMTKDFEK